MPLSYLWSHNSCSLQNAGASSPGTSHAASCSIVHPASITAKPKESPAPYSLVVTVNTFRLASVGSISMPWWYLQCQQFPVDGHPTSFTRHTGQGTWRFQTSSGTPHRCTVKVTGETPEPKRPVVRKNTSSVNSETLVTPSAARAVVDVTAATRSIAPAARPKSPNPRVTRDTSFSPDALRRGIRRSVSGFCVRMAMREGGGT